MTPSRNVPQAIAGVVNFKVAGQTADPKWKQTMLKQMVANGTAPTEKLRFQCRIATDARENFEKIELSNGETLTLHQSSKPQFGKNAKGHAYLTATLIYSGDGEAYRVHWVGDAVPRKMQEVAVKHDQGLAVRATTIPLDLSAATITPSWVRHGKSRIRGQRDHAAENARRNSTSTQRGKAAKSRTCNRLTAEDLG